MFDRNKKLVIVKGVKIPIDPDFRLMCEYSSAVSRSDKRALRDIAGRFFFAGLPFGVEPADALDGMGCFYADGIAPDREEKEGGSDSGKKTCFDFEEDSAYFKAAFLSEYGIDLEAAELHWFTFCELFRGLPDECRLKRIMAIRNENLSEIKSKSERAHIAKLQKIFALKKHRPKKYKSAAERDAAMKEDLRRKVQEVRGNEP